MRLHVTQKPFDGHEGDDPGNHSTPCHHRPIFGDTHVQGYLERLPCLPPAASIGIPTKKLNSVLGPTQPQEGRSDRGPRSRGSGNTAAISAQGLPSQQYAM